MRTGRPRQFDRDDAVRQAMHLFWEQGYEATSLAQLKAAIGRGITAPSFYAAFGSKAALFRETISCYMNSHGRVNDVLWDDALPPRQAIETALRQSVKMQFGSDHPKGCMVALGVMSACATLHQPLLQPLQDARRRTRNGFKRCIERGVQRGELSPETDIDAMTALFDSFLLGVSTLVRDGVTFSAVDAATSAILKHWDYAA